MADRILSQSAYTAVIRAPIEWVDIADWLLNVEQIGAGLVIQHYIGEATEKHHCHMASHSDVYSLNGRTKIQVIWDLSVKALLADVFALYLKTKNFRRHMSAPHFCDYHLLLDEQADQLYAMTDAVAEGIRTTGGFTLRSIGHIARTQRIMDNGTDYVDPLDMLAELREDNLSLEARLRELHSVVDELRDIATASRVETWIDETERRTWFLFETSRRVD